MSTSCGCLKMCSVAVACFNLALGIYILVEGGYLIDDYLKPGSDQTVGFIIVSFQMGSFLMFVGVLLLLGIFQNKEKHISLYLLLSSLIWFVITTLTVSYIYYNDDMIESPTSAPIPKDKVPTEKAVGFSIGLVVTWCGQIGVYKYHDQVMEKIVINTGQSYVTSAIHSS